jgi:biopolymer transport protein ExbD
MLDPPTGKRTLPVSERRYAFTLMPLADAMMQLLIFFMLSASMSTYSLLDISTAPPLSAGTGAGSLALPALLAGNAAEGAATWTVESGFVVSNGQRFGFDTLAGMVAALQTQTAPRVLLILRRGASVQDLVVVLEGLAAGGITQVQIVAGEAG